MVAGTLEVQMLANIARLADDMSKAKGVVTSTMKDIESAVESAKSVLATLGVGLSVGYFADLIKGSIEAANHLEHLSKSTNLNVETLAGLKVAAKQAGGDVDSIAASILKLSVNMGKAPEKFIALGVSAKDPLEAFKQLSDIFVHLEDPEQRAAVMATALGKSWAGAAPLLSEGSKRIGEMVAKGAEFSGVTTEMAKQSKELNENWILLVGTGGLLTRLVGPLLPLLNFLADDMLKAREQAGGLDTGFKPLLETGKVVAVLFANLSFVLKTFGDTIGGVLAWLDAFGKGEWKRAISIDAQMKQNAIDARIALDKYTEGIMAIGTAAAATAPKVVALTAADVAAAKAAADRAKEFLGHTGNAAVGAATYAAALQALHDRLNNTADMVNDKFYKELAMLNDEFVKGGSKDLPAYVKSVETLIMQTNYGKASLKNLTDAAKENNKEFDKALAAQDALDKSRESAARNFREAVDLVKEETQVMGLNSTERKIVIELHKLEKAGVDTNTESVRTYVATLRDLYAQQESIRTQVSVWAQLGDAMGGFLNALTHGFKSAMDYVKNLLLQLLAQMIQIFATRWVLSIGASMTSGAASGALTTAAGVAGQGTFAGSLMSTGSSLYSAGSAYFGASAATGAWTSGALAAEGYAGGTAAAAGAGSGVMSGIAAAVPWIAAAIAIYAAFNYFKDKGENWKGQLAFGAAATAYTTESVFGREGFSNLQGNDATNRGIQAFMASTGGIDRQLAGHLTASQIADIRTSLAGPYTRRNDGQPIEMAFDKNDTTAPQQLTLEYLQKKYGTVFDRLDKTFADFIRGYTGKSTDLLAEIANFAALLDAISATPIKGFSIEALRGFQRAGEAIGDTFTRITNQWAWFVNNFTTPAEKLTNEQNLVIDTFKQLGIAVPDGIVAFRHLVEGIDVSTEAGRTLFNLLMTIAPAFLVVANAAGTTTTAITDTTAALAAQAAMQVQIQASVNADRQSQLNAIVSARGGLRTFLTSTLLNTSVTALDPMQRLGIAKGDFERLLQLAKGGDLGAAGQLGGSASTYLGIAREVYKSSPQYVDIFNAVTGGVQSVDYRLNLEQRMLESALGLAHTTTLIYDTLGQINGNVTAGTAAVVAAVTSNATPLGQR